MRSPAIRTTEDATLAAHVVGSRALAGVTAGSALLRSGSRLLAVHDDAFRVTLIAPAELALASWAFKDDGAPLAREIKPDFEAALAGRDGWLYLLGSGSTSRRCTIARLDPAREAASFLDGTPLYECVRRALALAGPPNVEGALIVGDRLRLFHRGVAGEASGWVDLPLQVLEGDPPRALAARRLELGRLDGVPLGLTDVSATTGGRILFVATAEDTADAVTDGPVVGSVVGVLPAAKRAGGARWTRLVTVDGAPFRAKVEGLVVDDDLHGAWILTDADDPHRATLLGRIELAGFRP